MTIPIAKKEPAIEEKHVSRRVIPVGTKVFVPDVFAKWPFPRRISPYYPILKQEADAWINSFQAFSPRAQDAFNRCDFNLLACLAHPTSDKWQARAGCDFMHLLFVIDEYWEKSDPSVVREQREMILDAFQNPHVPRPKGEWIGGEITRQFWERTIQNATAVSQKRFIKNMDDSMKAAIQESTNKKNGHILDIESYVEVRRNTCGVKPSFSVIDLSLDIPDEVMYHPAIQETFLAACDLVGLSNDVVSYNLEQHRGDDIYNIVTCVMAENNTDVNHAMYWVEEYLLRAAERFLAARASLPQWEEPINSQVQEYCDGLGQWVRANYDWSFESERYFGKKGLEIRERQQMSLLPKDYETEVGPVHIDSSLL